LRRIDREHIKFDFCPRWRSSASFAEEFAALGRRDEGPEVAEGSPAPGRPSLLELGYADWN
jgi:hypothetical protein